MSTFHNTATQPSDVAAESQYEPLNILFTVDRNTFWPSRSVLGWTRAAGALNRS